MFWNHPATAPLLIIWGAILLLVFTVSFFSYMNRRNKYRVLEKLAENGQTLSPELLASLSSGPRFNIEDGRNPIKSGIYQMCIGVALALFFWAMTGGGNPFTGEDISWLPVIGIFPFMTGLARVLGVVFANRPKPDEQPSLPDEPK